MEQTTKIEIVSLTKDSVTIKKQNCIIINEVEYEIGKPWCRAYQNSIQGRKDLANEVEEKYSSIILSFWE